MPKPLHEVERNLLTIKHLGADGFDRPKIYPSKADFELAKSFTNERPYLVIAPSSVWFTKTFPLEKWGEFLQKLPPKYDVFLIGAPNESAICEKLRQWSPRAVNLAGKLTLLQSAALMAGAVRTFVNDSAPLHLAGGVNAPVTAVFCSTVSEFGFTPLSDDSAIVETREQLSCRPCGLHGHKTCPQGHFRCATGILIEQLLETLPKES